MKKKLLVSVLILSSMFCIDSQAFSASKTKKVSPVSLAIKKYKAGNYTGCLQDMQSIVAKDPSNAVAYYYIAMSYTQAGRQDKAIEAYSKVLSLKPNPTLYEYATTGKMCLETPDKCKFGDDSGELDKMIKYDYGKGLSNEVRKNLEQKRLDVIKQEMNSDKEMDSYDLRKFKDYSNQHSRLELSDKLAMAAEEGNVSLLQKNEQPKQPTNDEIVAALRVLNQAGLTNFANPLAQANNPMMSAQSAEMAQMSMMLGGNNMQNTNNNNNAMLNMLPFMMAQKQNGESNYTPQLMQAMLMNSMMPDFNYSLNNDK